MQSNVFCFSIIVEEVRIFSLYESSNISHRFHIGIPLESIAKGNNKPKEIGSAEENT